MAHSDYNYYSFFTRVCKKTYEIKNIIEAQFELMRQEINVMQNSKRKPVKCIFHLTL